MNKILLCILATISISAYSKPVAYIPNTSGGKIVITNDVCKSKDGKKVYEGMYRCYAYTPSGDTSEGCFEFDGNTVHVFWPDIQKEKRYELDDFIMIEKK